LAIFKTIKITAFGGHSYIVCVASEGNMNSESCCTSRGRVFLAFVKSVCWRCNQIGYYSKGTLVERLREDIVAPARARGYENIWLLGISMGGLGALLYVAEYPNEIDGVILIAPFLGSSKLVEEIENAGGLGAWSGASQGFKPYEIDVWAWLKKEIVGGSRKPVYIGFGQSDSMAPAYDVLVQALDPSHVYTSNGGHNWKTWKPLWARIAAELEDSRGN